MFLQLATIACIIALIVDSVLFGLFALAVIIDCAGKKLSKRKFLLISAPVCLLALLTAYSAYLLIWTI